MLGLLKKFKAKREYKKILKEVSDPLLAKIESIPEDEFKEFFRWTIEAAERSLRYFLFIDPLGSFGKDIEKEKIDFWLRKVSLVLMSYSFWCLMIVKQDSRPHQFTMVKMPFRSFWKKVSNYYKQIFDEELKRNDIDYYAAGYKKDTERGYSAMEDNIRVLETCKKDCETIGTELLEKVWKESPTKENYDRRVLIGARIWQVHAQLIRPCLMKINTGW